jgi:Prokaryotic RING finger family 1
VDLRGGFPENLTIMRLLRMGNRNLVIVEIPANDGVALDGLARVVSPDGKACTLIAKDGVRVNGFPALPAMALVERDEIRAGGQRYFLAADETAAMGFAGDSKTRCARCKDLLSAGEQVIFCPRCRSVHHEGCWSYGPRCAACEQEVAGEWRPE